jgi:type VI secretion system secreted protein Hcp
MAIDAFLDFTNSTPPVQGESQDNNTPSMANMFHVKSFSFSITQKGTASTGSGLGAGKAEFEDFEFTIDTQKGSAFLMKHCAAGTHFTGGVKLHVRKAGGGQEEFLTYTFQSVLISSFSTSGEEESTDTVKFNYMSVFAKYIPQDNNGKLLTGSASQGGWDLKQNKEVTG